MNSLDHRTNHDGMASLGGSSTDEDFTIPSPGFYQPSFHSDIAAIDASPSMTKTAAMGSATLAFASSPGHNKTVDKPGRKSSLHVLLPRSLQSHHSPHDPPSPPQLSPGRERREAVGRFKSWSGPGDHGEIYVDEPTTPRLLEPPFSPKDGLKATLSSDGGTMTKLMKRESYKAQRKSYQLEKKRVANELFSMLKDPSIIVLADWLKVRGTLKGWTKLWCVLKPGLLLLYKSTKTHKSSHWVGTILISTCELIERPSKKDGFCFKMYHPLEQSIWATRGPGGETMGAVVQPLPNSYLIFRAPSESAGKCWMDALELALRCSSLLIRSMSREGKPTMPASPQDPGGASTPLTGPDKLWNESDCEQHFLGHDLEDDQHTDDNREPDADGIHSLRSTDSDSEGHDADNNSVDRLPVETPYVESGKEEFGLAGDAGQTEEVADENKSLIWTLVKQVRPGMDLSKVVLPTFILEPRSFLDKLTDYYYHSDIVSKAVLEDDPFNRMKSITQFYLSGFYKKPRGLKKPYNPILGEVFRCYWQLPNADARTFYIAEQVSHHPPVSAFYVTNRKDGFCLSGSILAKSKFYGNSLSAILDGKARLHLLTRGEDYILTMPYAHCKGILVGTLTMELGGKVNIDCEKTGYHTELEFKLKPFLGGSESANAIMGKIKLGKETLAVIDGHWDQEIFITEKRTAERQVFWSANREARAARLKRFTVAAEHQREYESERLWQHVSAAIAHGDQVAATDEKTLLEEAQRQAVKERKAKREDWNPRFFEQDQNGDWVYKHADSRPWDPRNDVLQYECDCAIKTKTRLRTPIVRTSSIVGVDSPGEAQAVGRVARGGPRAVKPRLSRRVHSQDSGSSSREGDTIPCSDSSDSEMTLAKKPQVDTAATSEARLEKALQPLRAVAEKNAEALAAIQRQLALAQVRRNQRHLEGAGVGREWIFFALVVIMQLSMHWILKS